MNDTNISNNKEQKRDFSVLYKNKNMETYFSNWTLIFNQLIKLIKLIKTYQIVHCKNPKS